MKSLRIVLTDGRELKVKHLSDNATVWLLDAKEDGYFTYYTNTDERWHIPYHAILLVMED